MNYKTLREFSEKNGEMVSDWLGVKTFVLSKSARETLTKLLSLRIGERFIGKPRRITLSEERIAVHSYHTVIAEFNARGR